MLKKSFILVVSFALLQIILISCGRTQRCKGKYNSLTLHAGKDLPYPRFDLLNYDVVHFDSLTLSNNFSVETYECHTAKNMSFITSAYAFKPASPLVTIDDRIDSIKFTTIRNYNNTHPAGSSMNDILYHKMDNANNWTGLGVSITQIISDINTRFEKETQDPYPQFYTRLTEKPSINNDSVQIAVNVYLRNGIVFGAQTKPFILKF